MLLKAVACFSELYETDCGRRLGILGATKGMICERLITAQQLEMYSNRSAVMHLLASQVSTCMQSAKLNMNKYYGPTDPAFEMVSGMISEIFRRGNAVVRCRPESTCYC